MPLGDVVDELHDQHCLADAGAAEQADLAAALVGREQVHHLGADRSSGVCRGRQLVPQTEQPAARLQAHAGSLTLMPVARISCSVLWSTKGGASRWMGA